MRGEELGRGAGGEEEKSGGEGRVRMMTDHGVPVVHAAPRLVLLRHRGVPGVDVEVEVELGVEVVAVQEVV